MTDPEPPDETKLWALRVAKGIIFFVYAVVTVCLVLLTLGFVLRLFGANTDADFTEWVYRNVDRIMEPFRGMFPTHALNGQSVVDFSLLFAMVIYGIAAVALNALVSWLARHIVSLDGPGEARRSGGTRRTR